MLAVLAGPVFNFLLTIVVFAGIAMWQGMPTERPTIGELTALPGVEQPLRAGDVLLDVNGKPVTVSRTSLPRRRRWRRPARWPSASSAAARASS